MNKAASALGKKGKGVPKTLSAEEIERRTKQLAEARKKRWPRSRQNDGTQRPLARPSVSDSREPNRASGSLE